MEYSDQALKELMRVDWRAGMLVQSAHMTHSQRRAEALFGLVADGLGLDPGILVVDGVGELIEVGAPRTVGANLEFDVYLKRGIVAYCKNGQVVVIPRSASVQSRVEYPAAGARATSLLLAISDNAITPRSGGDGERTESKNAIESSIVCPVLASFSLLTTDAFENQSAARVVPIALLQYDGRAMLPVAEYLPPVAQLSAIRCFDSAILKAIQSEFQGLAEQVEVLMAAGSGSAGQFGERLVQRHQDLSLLRSLLVAKQGMIEEIDSLSPSTLRREVCVPLSHWVRLYSRRVKRKELIGASVALDNVTRSRLQVSSSELLTCLKDLLLACKMGLGEFA